MGALLPCNSDYFRWMDAVEKLARAYEADGMRWNDAFDRALMELRQDGYGVEA